MKCPKCPTGELLPARTNENIPTIDGMKCPECASLYLLNESHHLVLIAIGTPEPKRKPAPRKLEDKDLKPGIDREGFMNVLKTVTRPIVKETPKVARHGRKLTEEDKAAIRTKVVAGVATSGICKELNCKPWQVSYYGSRPASPPMVVSQKRPDLPRNFQHFTPDQQIKIMARLAAGDRVPDIARDMNCTTSAIYKYRERISGKTATKRDAAKLAEAWLNSPTTAPPTLTIRMANNGFVVTDMGNDEFTYTRLQDLLQCITDFFGDPVPCNPTRRKESDHE